MREDFLEEYRRDISGTKKPRYIHEAAERLNMELLKYITVKNVQKLKNGARQRGNYEGMLKEAKERESQRKKQKEPYKAMINFDIRESMIRTMQFVMEAKEIEPRMDEDKYLSGVKNNAKEEILVMYGEIIQEIIRFLNCYGMLDEYIAGANSTLEAAGLGNLSYKKRTAPADMVRDEATKEMVKDPNQEIGVIDTFDKEFIRKNLSPEQIMVLYTYWFERFYFERRQIGAAMQIVEQEDLWEVMVNGSERDIDKLDKSALNNRYKQGELLRQLSIQGISPGEAEVGEKYAEFMKLNGLIDKGEQADLEGDAISSDKINGGNLLNLLKEEQTAKYLLLEALDTGKIEGEWGIADETEDIAMMAINSRDFMGPLGINFSKIPLEKWQKRLGIKNVRRYKDKEGFLDTKLAEALSGVGMPTTPNFAQRLKVEIASNPALQSKSMKKGIGSRPEMFDRAK